MESILSVPALKHYGHGELAGPASVYYLSRHRRTVSLAFQSAGGEARLPAANRMPGAGPDIFNIFNVGNDPFDVAGHTGTLVGTIPSGQMGVVDLSNIESEAGIWHMQISSYTAPVSTPVTTPPSSPDPSIPTNPTVGMDPTFDGTVFSGTDVSAIGAPA